MHFQVLRIVCETRKGPLDFVTSIRNGLANYYGNETVGEYINILTPLYGVIAPVEYQFVLIIF